MASPDSEIATAHEAPAAGMSLDGPLTLAESLVAEAGWSAANFGAAGANPPYLRIGGKLWVTLSDYEPCFSSFRRDRVLFRTKVGIAEHLRRYRALMVDPLAFEDCYGAGAGTEATFPFGAWLAIRTVTFEGIELWSRCHGRVMLPLAPLAVASAVWLRPVQEAGKEVERRAGQGAGQGTGQGTGQGAGRNG